MRRDYSQGFTILEVMIAMVLLAAAVFSLLSVSLSGTLQQGTTREYDIARNSAFAKLEEMRSFTFTNLSGFYNNTFFAVPGLTAPTGWAEPGWVGMDVTSDLAEVAVIIRWRLGESTDASVFNEYILRGLITRRRNW
jgi:prepilin-type N-terminal cleavage/methylation domain-containing protein